MDIDIEDKAWAGLTPEEKNIVLFHKQKDMLDLLLERGAISQEQHDKSLHDLLRKNQSMDKRKTPYPTLGGDKEDER